MDACFQLSKFILKQICFKLMKNLCSSGNTRLITTNTDAFWLKLFRYLTLTSSMRTADEVSLRDSTPARHC